MKTVLAGFLLTFFLLTPVRPASLPALRERWIFCMTNLLVDKNVNDLEPLFRRAAQAGYNGVVLSDSKFGHLNDMEAHYFNNIERVKKMAVENKLQIIPSVFPIGYSNDLLRQNPNLAEGLPVRAALFVVQNSIARPMADPAVELKGADFRNNFAGWTFHDDTVVADGNTARVTNPGGHNARFMQTVKLAPFHQYHVSVEVRTQDVTGALPEIAVLNKDGRAISFSNLGAARKQDWKLCHVVFNSLKNETANIYFGSWDMQSGTVQWRNPRIEETGLVNVVRRPGAPLDVKIENGRPLTEGKDFEPVADPRVAAAPGEYEVWHEPPVIGMRPGAVPDGTGLRVSYYHVVTVHDGQVMICPSEPATTELLRDQARRMHAAWGAKGYFMSHDEIRVLNWDKSCTDRHLDAGAILADNVKTCVRLLREVNPGGDIYVWSDMFDPTHNAVKDYYLVRGDLHDSWRGLDKDVIVVVWNNDKRAESMKWFAGLGNRMLVAGYYDDKPERIRDWLGAARGLNGLVGVMYTTWKNNYDDLEKFSTELREPPVP